MSRTFAQLEKDNYANLTEEEINSFKQIFSTLDEAVNTAWPNQYQEAFDVFLKQYGWHIRLNMSTHDLITFIEAGTSAVDQHFIKQLRGDHSAIWKQASGTLDINEDSGDILLEIYSEETIEGYQNGIVNNPARYSHDFIFGEGFGGPFTLYNCRLNGVRHAGKDFFKTIYSIEYVIFGVVADQSPELLIESGQFLFPGLADWYDGWKHAELLSNIEGKLTDLHLSKSESLTVNEEMELIFHDRINSRIEKISFSYLISYEKSLQFKYNQPVPFQRLMNDAITFLKLLEFANSKPLNCLLFGLTLPGYQQSTGSNYYHVSSFRLSKNKEVAKHSSANVHLIINHSKLGGKEELNSVILKWYQHHDFRNIIEYYLDSNNWFQDIDGAILSNVMFNNRFLNLIQGLEDCYRERYYNDTNETQFNANKSAVLKRITDDASLKQWLNNTFKFSGYLSLSEKLKIIVANCLPEITSVYGAVSFESFPRAAADFRNTLSHGKNKAINLGEKMHLHYQIARLLLLICILKSLELKDIKKLLHRHFELDRNMQEIIRLQKIYPD